MASPINFPNASDYAKMLQIPKIAFRDDNLKTLKVKCKRGTQPHLVAGNFACVAKGTYPDGSSIALRVFTQDAGGRGERYQKISSYLSQRNLSCLVNFNYLEAEEGILVRGKRFPFVTMEWVEGEIIFSWLKEQCTQQNRDNLAGAVERWGQLLDELRVNELAHGDLQQANVMVTPSNEMKLVDYDCMCVPDLVGERNLETGVVPYQHPGRDGETKLSLGIDNYSGIFITTALRALAEAPALWQEFVEDRNYDKILFTDDDFEEYEAGNPPEIFRKLLRSSDQELRELTEQLFELRKKDIDDVPYWTRLLNSYKEIQELLDAGQLQAPATMLRDCDGHDDAPDELKPLIPGILKHDEQFSNLRKAVEQGDEKGMQRHFDAALGKYDECKPALAIAKHADKVVKVLPELEKSHKSQQWLALEAAWSQHAKLLSKRKSVQRFEADLAKWKKPNAVLRRILQNYEQSPPDYEALVTDWARLTKLGGHPEAKPYEESINRMLNQHDVWNTIEALDGTPNERQDRELVDAWDEELFADWDAAGLNDAKTRVDRAEKRLQLLAKIKKTIKAAADPPTLALERKIVEAAQRIRGKYAYRQQKRVATAFLRSKAAAGMQAALETDDDRKIVSVYKTLKKLKSLSFLTGKWIGDRVKLAIERVPLLDRLSKLKSDVPRDKATKLLLKVFTGNEGLLKGCKAASRWEPQYQQAKRCKDALDRLSAAVAAKDDVLIATIADEKLLVDFPFPDAWTEAIDRAREGVRDALGLLEAVRNNDARAFYDRFDVEVIRTFPAMFRECSDDVVRLIQSEIAPIDRISLRPPFLNAVQKTQRNGTFQIKWGFPKPKYCDTCVLFVCGNEPGPGEELRDWDVRWQMRIDRQTFQNAGARQPIHPKPELEGCWVVAAAIIDLGDEFPELISDPLVLGTLE